jgi:hypothetical protein
MNWYKRSKIVDTTPEEERRTYLICPKCGRWAVNKEGHLSNDPEAELGWKYYYQMDPEEQMMIDEAKRAADLGGTGYSNLICDICRSR